jgi:hypothetical protein
VCGRVESHYRPIFRLFCLFIPPPLVQNLVFSPIRCFFSKTHFFCHASSNSISAQVEEGGGFARFADYIDDLPLGTVVLLATPRNRGCDLDPAAHRVGFYH